MNKEKIDLLKFDPSNIRPSGFVEENVSIRIKNQIGILHSYALELIKISNDSKELPQVFISNISNFTDRLGILIERIEEVLNGPPETIVQKKEQVINDLDRLYEESMRLSAGNSKTAPSMLETYCLTLAYTSRNHFDLSFEKARSNVTSLINHAENALNVLQNTSDSANTILGELQKKVAQNTVSDYAQVFENSADSHRRHSKYWLVAGGAISFIFIGYIITDAKYRFFPTEILDSQTNELLRYDLTNLATKIFLIAMLVFFISFSFKQYNVNRHLQTLNRHRQHALNSYILFSQSISGDDVSSRNSLMIHVAKAIYEHNQSTGYLSEKTQQINSGILELTKIIGESKPA